MPHAAPPWPLPLACGVVVGASATTAPAGLPHALPISLAIAALLACVALQIVLRPASGRAALTVAVAALLCGGGLAAGALRGHAWTATPDPWAGVMGEAVELVGRSDATVLWVAGRGGLVLRGVPLPEGRVRVVGTIEPLAGKRNPGGFDARAHWRRRGAWAVLRVDELVEAPRRAGARDALRRGVVAGLAPRAAGLVQAMTLGVRDDLGDLREVFAASGLAHVLALSGLHVGVLGAALAVAARPFGRARAPLVGVGIALYVSIVGASPSVLRAAIMIGAVLAAGALRAGAPALTASLAVAASLSLLLTPGWAHDLGFALSYLSVAGIAVVSTSAFGALPPGAGRGRRLGRAILGGVAVSVAAQGATASIVASSFGGLPLVSPLVNLVAVPLASLLVPLGFAAGIAGLLGEGAASAVNLLTRPLAESLIAIARFAARAPALPWGEVSLVGHVTYAAGAIAVAASIRRRLAPWRAAIVVLVAASVSAATPPRATTPELVVLDVGQGDAVVIRLGGGGAVLVDGGGAFGGEYDVGARVVVPALRALGVRALSVVVATHGDLDHIQGLASVLMTFRVGELWIGHREDDRVVFRDLVQAAALRGVPVREVRRGESARIGRVRLDVLHPTHERSPAPNDDSVVVVVRVDGAPWLLLAGDVSASVEAELAVPRVPIVLAPHHGSPTSTSEALLLAAQPRLAIVSVGRNRFGHPAPSVLGRLERHGVDVRTTLDEGAVRLEHASSATAKALSGP